MQKVFVKTEDRARCCHCGCRGRDLVRGRFIYKDKDGRCYCSEICRRLENGDPNCFEMPLGQE